MQQWYQCPKCGAPVPFGTRFCNNCGHQLNWPKQQQPQPLLPYYCPRCRSPISAYDATCQNCGIALSWSNPQQTQSSLPGKRDSASSPPKGSSVKFLKGAGISILSFLLFLSLSVFGPAFLLNQTLLNPGFVTSEVNRFELASVAKDLITPQSSGNYPKEIDSAVVTTISKLEPQLKEKINAAIYSVYDYLLGKRQSPNLSAVLRSTFLSSDFLVSAIDELDIASLVQPILHEQVSSWIPRDMAFLSTYFYPSLDKFLVSQEPWLKQQVKAAADPIADYLVGKRKNFTVSIPTKPIIDSLKETLLKDISGLPLPQLAGLPPALIQATFNEFFSKFSQGIPPSIEITETIIGNEVPERISAFLAEAENALQQMREYISYFQLWYVLLIIFMVLLVIGIILIYREVKGAARTLGILFLSYGVVEIIILLVARNVIREQLVQSARNAPAQVQMWLQQFLNNVSAPLQILCIACIVVGVALIVISFVYKSHRVAV